jgi:hypothetical protein
MSYSWGAGRNARVEGRHGRAALEAVPTPAEQILSPSVADGGAAAAGAEHHRVAAELAPMVDVWQRLLADHVPDPSGRCRTCTKGGTGLPSTSWPCSIRGIAEMARRRHDADLAAAARRERLSS